MNPDLKKELLELQKDLTKQKENMHKVLFKSTFDLIFELIDSKEILINIPAFNIVNHKAILSKNDSGGFTIHIQNILSDMSEAYDIELIIGNSIYLVPDLFISMRGTQLERNEHNDYFSGQLIFTGQIHHLKSNTFCKNEQYSRFIIPSKKHQLDYYISTEGYRDESSLNRYGRLSLKIDNSDFVLYEKKVRDEFYFIIDSVEPITHERFSDICHCIMVGFGFLSADFIQDNAFYITSENEDFSTTSSFSYHQLRPSLYSNGTCNPIYSNPYGYTEDETIINNIGSQIKVFDSSTFSKLCSKIYSQDDYATLILLILEANISSLILRPAGYSVALEKLTNIIVEENNGLAPIPDKALSKKLRKELKNVLTSFSEEINNAGTEDSLIILQKKIESINSPTNRDKLTKPFGLYNITLSQDDLNAINCRNNFLHGRNINLDENTDEYAEVYQISLRLNRLINILILKHIDYSGIIINHLKRNENSLGCKIDENLFEEI